MIEKLFKYKYILFFAFYILLVVYLSRNAELVFEWRIIINDFLVYGDYYYLGKPTAYMPPLYPYYLLLIKKLFQIQQWVVISCILQSIILFFSIFYLTKVIEKRSIKKISYFPAFFFIIMFPPILIGATKVSSFALTVSIFSIFFGLILEIFISMTLKKIMIIFFVSILGMYIRYEFIFIMIISTFLLIIFKKIKFYHFLTLCIFIIITYLPWSLRNYYKIGTFHYSTSLNYNFAKGNNIYYDILSSHNLPYDPNKKIILTDEYLRENFGNEKQIDDYLGNLNKKFISENQQLFITNSIKKIIINFTNYYPGNYNFSNVALTYLYSVILLIFNIIFIYIIFKEIKKKEFYIFFIALLFLFFLVFYSVAPLPRYFLFYFPILFLFIYQYFTDRKIIKTK